MLAYLAASPGRTIVAVSGGDGHFATARIFDFAPTKFS